MPSNSSMVPLIVVIGSTLLAVFGVRYLVKRLWDTAMSAYPRQQPAADAVYRRHQSFYVNYINMAMAIHVAVDDQYLHLTPIILMRWFGTAPVSIPWEDIRLVKPGGRILPATARLANGRCITGPRWCLQLAAPIQDAQTPTPDRAADEQTPRPAAGDRDSSR